MKIAIIGYSGSGKSTLAALFGNHFSIPVLHLDSVNFESGWMERKREEAKKLVADFLTNESWIIDGNYSELYFNERLFEADQIILLKFSRIRCFVRVLRRYHMYKGRTRPDLAENCPEKIDAEFLSWVLWKGRDRRRRNHFKQIAQRYADKIVVLKSPWAVNRFLLQNIT